ncbi:hypothetical protein GLOTRDRAFT_131882 [Gloeophyllum trabeum ATCC 11539]|uniref:Uncharacterized protein n=1 Tax=Gloeophyllum trabeum (strain ATCC 11539 / FP-39264 / Madison 617) TaxID=670483 RepID=S7REI3_GLOTA|nr:uncharacterized protein GLOTRDRAFT_131882 [Gloeophyllum trabeum ATCC 11539]EPQ52645.1 hypothetical protein GLOTRDRAFT_131882 [Gloeophyllum trabeum ATCC 11539]
MAENLGAQSTLCNYDRFRSYDDSPWPDELRYWGEVRERWCYIGEITEVGTVPIVNRMTPGMRDMEKAICTVVFHTTNLADSFRKSCVKGNTLVILYAKQNRFLDGKPGFRIEQKDLPYVKVRLELEDGVPESVPADWTPARTAGRPSTSHSHPCSRLTTD